MAVDAERPGKTTSKTRSERRAGKRGSDYGKALRSIYDEAVHEDIPPEMLDLLGKLS